MFGFKKNIKARIIIKSIDKVIGLTYRKLPEVGDEVIIAFNGKNNLIKITEIKSGNIVDIFAEEISDSINR